MTHTTPHSHSTILALALHFVSFMCVCEMCCLLLLLAAMADVHQCGQPPIDQLCHPPESLPPGTCVLPEGPLGLSGGLTHLWWRSLAGSRGRPSRCCACKICCHSFLQGANVIASVSAATVVPAFAAAVMHCSCLVRYMKAHCVLDLAGLMSRREQLCCCCCRSSCC